MVALVLLSTALVVAGCGANASIDEPDTSVPEAGVAETEKTNAADAAGSSDVYDDTDGRATSSDAGGSDIDASNVDAGNVDACTGNCQCVTNRDCGEHEDGNRCNGTLICHEGECIVDPATIVVCDTSNDTACASQQCEPATGACVVKSAPEGKLCDDGNLCTQSDACRLGVCKGTPIVCPMSCQACDAMQGCMPKPGWCAIDGSCYANGSLKPFTSCQWCAAANQSTAWSPQPPGTSCNDFNACSPTDACDGAGKCVGTSVLVPAVPTLRSPRLGKLTGSALALGFARITQPTFSWRHANDNCAQLATFEIQVDDSCTNVDMQSCTFPSPEASAKDLVALSWQVPTALPISQVAPVGRRYFWRVRACRETTCSAWSRIGYVDVGRVKNDFDGDGRSDLVVGSWLSSFTSTPPPVFVYSGKADGPSSTPTLEIPSPVSVMYTKFGTGLASGDVNGDGFADLVVGAYGQPASRAGRVYVYFGGPGGLSANPSQTIEAPNPMSSEPFPHGVSAAGDLNGDGFADIVAGQYTGLGSPIGYVFLGSTAGVSVTSNVAFAEPPPPGNTRVTRVVATDIDVDADAFADALIDIPSYSVPNGWVYVFTGGAGSLVKPPLSVSTNPPPTTTDSFGYALACGDFNGDGHGDAVVGDEARAAGTVLFYAGSSAGLPATPSYPVTSPPNPKSIRLGTALAAGDIDGDGIDDVLAGAPYLGSNGNQPGGAYVYRGSLNGLQGNPWVSLSSPVADAYGRFGDSLTIPGDVDGDGRADVVVAGSEIDGITTNAGAVFVYLSGATGLATSPVVRLDRPATMTVTGFGGSLLP